MPQQLAPAIETHGMHVHCPDCSYQFDCTVLAAGELLRCPSCQSEFKISAKETVFYLDSMKDGCNTVVVGPQSGLPTLDGERLAPGERIGGFVIDRELGRGGMGVVYLATQISLGKQRALKVLRKELATDAQFLKRFHRETRALAELDQHPNIISVIDTGHYQGIYYLVMEYVEGITLRELFDERKLTPDEALQLVPQICSALEYAHTRGVIHRDIKPENIIIDRQQNLRIADFGLSKILGEQQFTRLTATNTIMGTYEYMAPEQKTGSEGVDHRADLYSLGVVLYEMLTGEVPAGNFEPPSKRNVNLSKDIDRIIMRVLERDPNRRYQKASELATDIKQAGKGKIALTIPKQLAAFDWKSIKRQTMQFVKRHNWWFYVLLVLCIFAQGALPIWIFIGLTIWFWEKFSDNEKEQPTEPELQLETPPQGRAGCSIELKCAVGSEQNSQPADLQTTPDDALPVLPSADGEPTRTSRRSMLIFLISVPLLVSGVVQCLAVDSLRGMALMMSEHAQAAFIVGMAAWGLIPGLGMIGIATSVRRHCARNRLRGRHLAALTIIWALVHLAGTGYLISHLLMDGHRWRTIEQQAMRKGDSKALDTLERELHQPTIKATRSRAAKLLTQHYPKRAMTHLKNESARIRVPILRGFLESSNEAYAALAAVKTLQLSRGITEKKLACQLIQRHRPEAALPDLLELLKSSWGPTKEDVAYAVLAYRSPGAIQGLEQIAGSRLHSDHLRTSAVSALAQIGTPESAQALVRLLKSSNYSVRYLSDLALRELTGNPDGAGIQLGEHPGSDPNMKAIETWLTLVQQWGSRNN